LKQQRIVVKVGTSTITHDSGALNLHRIEQLVRVLADLSGMGHQVILVSSGAIAVGAARLNMPERPRELRLKQAAAAVGQCRIMRLGDSADGRRRGRFRSGRASHQHLRGAFGNAGHSRGE